MYNASHGADFLITLKSGATVKIELTTARQVAKHQAKPAYADKEAWQFVTYTFPRVTR